MKQYQQIKERYPDAILFFRLGDFYEMFGEDAKAASSILQIALTSRDKSKDDPVPMCGIPYFSAETYINKLIGAGRKVAVCEQVEDPKDAKGIVMREVVRVVTPGTHTPENPKENNFIASFFPVGRKHGIALADISTGEFFLFETGNPFEDEIGRFEPREIVYPESLGRDLRYAGALKNYFTTAADDFLFDYSEAYRGLLSYFKVSSLAAFGCEGLRAAVSAAGALLSVLLSTQRGQLSFTKLIHLKDSSAMFLDYSTRRNLELIHNLKDGGRDGTLLWALDETLTPMGGRFLRNAVLNPLVEADKVNRRLGAVSLLVGEYELTDRLRGALRKIQDLERLGARVRMGTANARDLVALKNSLKPLPGIKKALASSEDPVLTEVSAGIGDFTGLCDFLETSIKEHPPLGLKDGGIIKENFHSQVDELRMLCTHSRDYIAGIEAREKQDTGIASLKVGFNRVFGYFIEITKPNLPQVPVHYIRKQTLVNAERFITPELKEYETKTLGAQERLTALEYEVFTGVLEKVKTQSAALRETAQQIGRLDFLISLAIVAKRNDYVRPEVDDSFALEIENGRHPVIERLQLGERFIPNSVFMDGDDVRMLIITGPNMAGKSTYMRQNALIALMAQVGSFVPADRARMGIADRIFTRIGASDFLSMGQSTFMVEMLETANIIHNATKRSIIVLDEVGRGTSTFDGISIAWAAAEHIVKDIKARTFFATHYNELTELAMGLDGIKNCNVAVKEWGDEIIFLRRIEDGPSDKSYGIQVGRLAGLPQEIVERAKAILSNLEKQVLASGGTPRLWANGQGRTRQLGLFGNKEDAIVEELLGVPEDISAEQALQKLLSLKKKAKGK
ncbi:MAG: DNA mismatch repair protein MutS [Nitrospiraceae bacterium]|nr:DNA mismatch repair protein MutS [Nitrospiraceae bacterium]